MLLCICIINSVSLTVPVSYLCTCVCARTRAYMSTTIVFSDEILQYMLECN
jgi:hypothetical protein